MRENLLDVPQAADLLHLTPAQVRRLVAKQAIPFLMIGPFVRFDRATLETWSERLARVELRESPIDLRTPSERARPAADHTRRV
jgi:excisionase family DNA binding protein